MSLLFAGLAWHELLTIWLGWYWLPTAAIITFSVATRLQIPPYTHYVLYASTTPLGFVLLGFAIFKLWRRNGGGTPVSNSLPASSGFK